MRHTLHIGDNLAILPTLPDNSVDAIVTDPPYGLVFMGKDWDKDVPGPATWRECLRVLKPGGHLLAFAGTRTQHKMATAIELAGFEIRDMIAWVYGSGFPKSLDVSKAIDKAAGAEREVVGDKLDRPGYHLKGHNDLRVFGGGISSTTRETRLKAAQITAPATEAARKWHGWGTALKPALEPITVARKPIDGTVAENVQRHGTGAINVDACRVGTEPSPSFTNVRNAKIFGQGSGGQVEVPKPQQGRWPANLIHDGSQEVLDLFPETSSSKKTRRGIRTHYSGGKLIDLCDRGHDDNGGSAARFFYCPKANKRDRDDGCEGLEPKVFSFSGNDSEKNGDIGLNKSIARRNHHPTVKPTDLMRYLCRLVTPPRGTVLDPFTGSGSTGKAAILEGFNFIGIELSPDYAAIAEARIKAAYKEPD